MSPTNVFLLFIGVATLLSCLVYFQRNNGSDKRALSYHDDSHSSSIVPKAVELCSWDFVTYTPSTLEQDWMDNIDAYQYNMCDATMKQWDKMQKWLDYATPSQTNSPKENPDDSIFSKFTYRNSCTKEMRVSYIEPLASMMRSPKFCSLLPRCLHPYDDCVEENIKPDYLLFDWNEHNYYPACTKSVFIDVGATPLYGLSPWLYQAFTKRGFNLTHIYGWESAPQAFSEIWRVLPVEFHPAMHWMPIAASTDANSPDNPLNLLKKTCKKEDYVIFKLDIDNTAVELTFIDQILKDSTIPPLIDEFLFEYHVNISEMAMYWGTHMNEKSSDSYRLFSKFRHLGIKAHFWI